MRSTSSAPRTILKAKISRVNRAATSAPSSDGPARSCYRRITLESPNHGSDLGGQFEADVVQVHEFAAGHPTQIAKAVVAGAEQGPQHHWLEPDVVSGQVAGIIEPDIHPGGPCQACSRAGLTDPSRCWLNPPGSRPRDFPSIDAYYMKEPVLVLPISRVVLRRVKAPDGAAVDGPGPGFLRGNQVDPSEVEPIGLRRGSQVELQLATVPGIHQILLSGDRTGKRLSVLKNQLRVRLELPPLDALQELRQEAHRYCARIIQRIHAEGRPWPRVFAGRERWVRYVSPPLMPAAICVAGCA